jgi:hypothetical protein
MTNSAQMFLRPHQRNKDGKEHTYWSLVETVRTVDGPRQKTDDTLPWNCDAGGTCNGYPNNTAQEYVYGFRVPLLVVSPYVKLTNGQPGYISKACPGGNCQGQEKPPFIHDFGSILNFIEYALGTGGVPLGGAGGISPNYNYADDLAPDAPFSCTTCKYSLSDFFDFTKTPRLFSVIQGAKYDTSCFLNPATCFPNYPADPDDDAIDPQ